MLPIRNVIIPSGWRTGRTAIGSRTTHYYVWRSGRLSAGWFRMSLPANIPTAVMFGGSLDGGAAVCMKHGAYEDTRMESMHSIMTDSV